ncbi:MAG: tRNA (guanosine(46)-N7)-methyltransferase TrmB [Magnetococcales bacterium]|nr:tRNA (guanosine(46)-N7)-methyltransferase TrmB [Magnetococcales bacterium]
MTPDDSPDLPLLAPDPPGGSSPVISDAVRYKPRGRKMGFLNAARQERLARLAPRYALPEVIADRESLLRGWGADPATARLMLEIGFGNGVFTAGLARQHPGDRIIASEVFLEGVAGLLKRLETEGLENVRVTTEPAFLLLRDRLAGVRLDRVIVNFPDPWPKTRHHKRRLVQVELLDLLAERMVPGGMLEMATDWEEYAAWMMALGEGHGAFENAMGAAGFAPEPEDWTRTNFQAKGESAGRRTWHLRWRRRE